ncbi:MAG: Ig-like domain-containing protein [Planctomycetota bacterium]|jgi:hypothetical protein
MTASPFLPHYFRRIPQRVWPALILLFCLVLLTGSIALARNPYRKNFFDAYPSAEGTILDNTPSYSNHCGVCHFDFGGGGARNPYGLAVEATDRSVAAILVLDSNDADLDGYSNGIEITDTINFSNTPTFPGLTAFNVGLTSNVVLTEIQDHLKPSSGGDTDPPDVTVVTPNGGYTYTANNAVNVQWTATDAGDVAGVDLMVSIDNGATFKFVAIGLSNTGSHTWFPANRPTTQAIFRVIAIDDSFNEGYDDSDAVFEIQSPLGGLAPTTLRDFDQPGSQPFESGILNPPEACAGCHGNYDPNVEPLHNWRGSMMALASFDPIFKANMVIANQDAPDSGDLCLRCHLPRGWLQGRSVPTDGSAMLPTDTSGVSCDLCHRMVDPFYDPGQNPPEDAAILAALSNPPSNLGNGQYIVDPTGARRGPFVNADSGHPVLVSPFHRESKRTTTAITSPTHSMRRRLISRPIVSCPSSEPTASGSTVYTTRPMASQLRSSAATRKTSPRAKTVTCET